MLRKYEQEILKDETSVEVVEKEVRNRTGRQSGKRGGDGKKKARM